MMLWLPPRKRAAFCMQALTHSTTSSAACMRCGSDPDCKGCLSLFHAGGAVTVGKRAVHVPGAACSGGRSASDIQPADVAIAGKDSLADEGFTSGLMDRSCQDCYRGTSAWLQPVMHARNVAPYQSSDTVAAGAIQRPVLLGSEAHDSQLCHHADWRQHRR